MDISDLKRAGFCPRYTYMVDWNSKGLLNFVLIEPAKHVRRRKWIFCLMRDVEPCGAVFLNKDIVANVRSSLSDFITEFIRLGIGSSVMWICASCKLSTFLDIIQNTSGPVKFFHAPFIVLLSYCLNSIGIVEREYNLRLDPSNGVSINECSERLRNSISHIRRINAAINDAKCLQV